MFTLKNETEFDSSHFLSGYKGKCANIHGHRYKLVVKVRGQLKSEGQTRGMVEDFSYIKRKLKEIHDIFDHKLIMEDNDEGRRLAEKLGNEYDYLLVSYRPTAEEMSRDIFRRLRSVGLNVTEVELFETGGSSCIYTEE